MSIKGVTQIMYVGGEEARIITLLGRSIPIIYSDLKRIDYMYAAKGESGYVDFINNNNKATRFEFNAKANDQISRTIKSIHKNYPDLMINEKNAEDLRFYERWWFMVLTMFFFCFPLGLFLMWHKKKSTLSFRVTLTLLITTLWGIGIYASYINYISAMNEASAALADYQNILSGSSTGTEANNVVVDYSDSSDTGSDDVEGSDDSINTFNVGDVYEDDDVKIMYISSGDYSVENEYSQPESGNKYIYVEFSIENVGESDCSAGYADFSCYADNTECSTPIISSEGAMTIITTLSPGRNTKGKIFYEVPTKAEKIEIEYQPSIFNQEKIYFKFE